MSEFDELKRAFLQSRAEAAVKAAIGNARAFLAVQAEFGSFSNYIWGFVSAVAAEVRKTHPDKWIGALRAGVASDMGMRYNTGVWLECRKHAVGFLEEAKARLAALMPALKSR